MPYTHEKGAKPNLARVNPVPGLLPISQKRVASSDYAEVKTLPMLAKRRSVLAKAPLYLAKAPSVRAKRRSVLAKAPLHLAKPPSELSNAPIASSQAPILFLEAPADDRQASPKSPRH